MQAQDIEYYRARAKAERHLARASENEDVAAIHEELAWQYEALVHQVELRPILRIAVPPQAAAER